MALDPKIEFRDPPKVVINKDHTTNWDAVVRELKTTPGEWGMVGIFSAGIASHIKAGRYEQFHPYGKDKAQAAVYMRQHWEVTVRKADGGYELYIRWLG